MHRCATFWALMACTAFMPAADEISLLQQRVDPPARFADHRPQFSIEETERSFRHHDGSQTWQFFVLKDGERIVAYVPKTGFHGGSIYQLTHDPALAPTTLDLPTERFHIDTAIGASFRTDHFLPTKNWNDGDTSAWTVADDGSSITLTRRYTGTLQTYKWELDTRRNPLEVDHVGTYVLRFDPHFGYTIEATWQTGVSDPKRVGQYVSLYPPFMSNPWVTEGIHNRVAICPPDGGYEGHANNHPAIHRSDRHNWRLRDGGFASYLTENDWSWTTAMTAGGEVRLSVCNVHADQDYFPEWPHDLPKADNGLTYHTITARQLRIPPEMTMTVWNEMRMRYGDASMLVIPLGRATDFSEQPLPMDQTHIGMTFTDRFPPLVDSPARSGKSMVVRGTVFPNLPQVALKPDTRYRLEGWFKVEPATDEQIEELRVQHGRNEERRRQNWERQKTRAERRGEEIEPFVERPWQVPAPATAFITGHYYVWSPHNHGDRVLEQTTTIAGISDEWQHVVLDLTTPDWGPFIDIRFVCTGGGTAYLDAFSMRTLAADEE